MTATTRRLVRRVRRDFGAEEADEVLEGLSLLPEKLPGAVQQDPERVQAALVVAARGDHRTFQDLLTLAETDWRDLLVAADLAGEDWPERLRAELGR